MSKMKEIGALEAYHKGVCVDDIIALKLDNPNMTLNQAAKILGCVPSNIIGHLTYRGLSWTGLAPGLQRYRKNRADILAEKGRSLLSSLTPSKQTDMSGLQLATAFGILYDKERLERGQSTANVAYNDLTRSLEDIEAEIARLQGGGAPALDLHRDPGMEYLEDQDDAREEEV